MGSKIEVCKQKGETDRFARSNESYKTQLCSTVTVADAFATALPATAEALNV